MKLHCDWTEKVTCIKINVWTSYINFGLPLAEIEETIAAPPTPHSYIYVKSRAHTSFLLIKLFKFL